MRRGISFVQVLLVAITLLLTAAILYPAFVRPREFSGPGPISDVKQLADTCQMYVADWSETFPLAYGTDGRGHYGWNRGMLTPASTELYKVSVQHRIPESRSGWANTLQGYHKSYRMLDLRPRPFPQERFEALQILPAGSIKGKSTPVGITYNGLVQALQVHQIARPNRAPVFWNGLGRAKIENLSYSSPSLVCVDSFPAPCSYVPSEAGCSSAQNGSTSRLIQPQASMWVHAKGMYMVFADSSTTFVRFTADAGGRTDYNKSPFTGYDEKGVPSFHWWDGCHPWLFRPDYDFEEAKP